MNTTAHRTNWMLRLAVGIALVFAGAELCSADGFFDDFEDGDVTNDIPLSDDGTPVIWTPNPIQPGDYDVLDGDYVLAPVPEGQSFMASNVEDVDFGGTSIRSRMSMSQLNGRVGLTVRNQNAGDTHNYTAMLYTPNQTGSSLQLYRSGDGDESILLGSVAVFLLNPSTDDAMLQLDAFGDELKVWAWKAGDPMPGEPQLTRIDSTYESGFAGILSVRGATGSFRSVEAADMHIPEPSALTLAALGLLGLIARRRRRTT
jgi:hypothetical protein